jgi:hypothetical protein
MVKLSVLNLISGQRRDADGCRRNEVQKSFACRDHVEQAHRCLLAGSQDTKCSIAFLGQSPSGRQALSDYSVDEALCFGRLRDSLTTRRRRRRRPTMPKLGGVVLAI